MRGTIIKSLKFKTTQADIVFLHSSNLLTIFLTNDTISHSYNGLNFVFLTHGVQNQNTVEFNSKIFYQLI